MARIKRFSVLDAAIGKYKATAASTTDPIAKYKVFKSKDASRGYAYTVNGRARGQDVTRGLLPFGVPSAGDKILVPASGRALNEGLGAAGLAESDLALSAVDANVKPNASFKSAVAIVKTGNTTSSGADKTPSRITGVRYRKGNGTSYNFPFGQSTGERSNVLGAQQYIASRVYSGGGNRSITFQPERFFSS